MIQSFIEGIINYQFLQYALITSMLVGLASGVIGSFIILRGMSLMGDAISHAVLPGVAISYMFGFSYILGATIVLACATFCMLAFFFSPTKGIFFNGKK